MTITGRTIGDELESAPARPRADQDVIPSRSRPMYPQGHVAILRGNLALEGCVAKITGPARALDSEPAAMAAIMAKRIRPRRGHRSLRRAEGWSWHAGTVVGHAAPEPFAGGTIALEKKGVSITMDAKRCGFG